MIQEIIKGSTRQSASANSDLISFDEAQRLLIDMAKPVGTERVSLGAGDDRILAAPVIAQRSAPIVAVSAMDGFAVRDEDTRHLPAYLKIVGKSFAGAKHTGTISSGQCVRIFTGAPLPLNADRVVIQEDVIVDGTTAYIETPPSDRRHVRAEASDFAIGDTIVSAGQKLRPQHLIAAAAANLGELDVYCRPKVHIVCCGDELAPSGTVGISSQQVPESVSVGIAAMARRWGAFVTGYSLLGDDIEALTVAASEALRTSDIVVIIGGASVGEKDFAKAAFAPLGMSLVFNKVAIKPGKPVWLGNVCSKPVLGLPGNPTSALITARLFLAPLLAEMAGGSAAKALNWHRSRFKGKIKHSVDRDIFLRAQRVDDYVHQLSSQDSADQKSLAETRFLIRVPPGDSHRNLEETWVDTIEL